MVDEICHTLDLSLVSVGVSKGYRSEESAGRV